MSEIIITEIISKHHYDPLADHFSIEKTSELVAQKYYGPILQVDIEIYMKRCDVCVTSKAVRHKPYGDLQSLPISIHRLKNLSIDFDTSLLGSTNWESEIYNIILVIVNWLIKIVYYELVKVTIDAPGIAEVINDVVVRHYRLPDSIVGH